MAVKRLLAGAAFLAVTMAFLTFPDSNLAVAQESPDTLSNCVRENRSLSTLFLVDASLSLQANDPEDERVQAIHSALSALGALHSSTDVDVNVEFLDFSDVTRKSFSERSDWASVPIAPSDQLGIARQYADRDQGSATDYVAALEPWINPADKPVDEIGALEMLERAPLESCRLLVWFTDGQFDVNFYGTPRTVYWTETPTVIDSYSSAAAVEALAIERLCRSGGLADVLRQGSDIANGAGAQVSIVALDKEGTLDFSLLRAFATGEGREGGCGSEMPRGTFGTADDIGALAIGLREAVLGVAHGDSRGTQSCLVTSNECEDLSGEPRDYDYTFFMSSGFERFNLLTVSSHPSVTTTLISPRGASLVLRSGIHSIETDGVDLNVQELELQNGGFLIDGELSPDGEWVGNWRVRYSTTDPEVAAGFNRASIYVFGSLMLTLDESQASLHAGIEEEIVVRVVGGSNEPATDTVLQPGTKMQLWVDNDIIGLPTLQPDGTYSARYTVPVDFNRNEIAITGVLEPIIQLGPAAPLVPLTPWMGVLGEVTVVPVGDYPVVGRPAPFGEVLEESVRSISTTLVADASQPGTGGCVDLVDIQVPRIGTNDLELRVLVGETRILDGEHCSIELAEGDTASVSLVVDAGALASLDGEIQPGSITLRASNPIDSTRSRDYTYGIELSVELPETITETDTVKAAILVLLPVLFLIGLLFVINVVTSRLVVGRTTTMEFPAEVVGSVMYRLDDAGSRIPLVVEGRDISSHPLGRGEGRASSIEAGAVSINARTPLVPGSKSFASVSYSGATLVIASRGTSENGQVGLMSNVLSGEWVFYSDQSIPEMREGSIDDPIVGSFMMMIPYGTDASFAQAQLEERSQAIAEQVHMAATDISKSRLEKPSADQGDGDAAHAQDDPQEFAEDPATPAQALAEGSTSDDAGAAGADHGIWDFEEEDDW